MRVTYIFFGLLALWALMFFGSLPSAMMTAPNGDGFTRGLNRILLFFQMQGVAAVLALIIWVWGRQIGANRWAYRVPGLMALCLVLVVGLMIAWAVFAKPSSVAPTAPPAAVTQPAQPLDGS